MTTDDPERVSAALTVAVTAAASGADVSLWLTGPAAWLAVPGREPDVDIEFSLPLAEAWAQVPRISVCSQCAARRAITPGDLREPATIRGAAGYVEEILAPDAQALVY